MGTFIALEYTIWRRVYLVLADSWDTHLILRVCDLGIWIRSIKTETNLPQTVLMKVMRSLEKRDLVKTIKSIKVGFGSGLESNLSLRRCPRQVSL